MAERTRGKRFRVVDADVSWFLKNISCQDACPVHTDVANYVAMICEGRFQDAYQLNQRYNVFPSILGRICTRRCESACRRSVVDGPVAICYLKRSTGDMRDRSHLIEADERRSSMTG